MMNATLDGAFTPALAELSRQLPEILFNYGLIAHASASFPQSRRQFLLASWRRLPAITGFDLRHVCAYTQGGGDFAVSRITLRCYAKIDDTPVSYL